jgi:hypothetical protein
VSNFSVSISVDWTNPSGTEAIGSWNTSVGVGVHSVPATEVTNYAGVIANGKVHAVPPCPWPDGDLVVRGAPSERGGARTRSADAYWC